MTAIPLMNPSQTDSEKRNLTALQIDILKNEGLSLSSIAEKIGITRGYLSTIYNKHIDPPDSFLYKFHETFKEYLFSHTEHNKVNDDFALYSPSSSNRSIKYYNADVIDGKVDIWSDDSGQYASDRFVIPSFNDCDHAISISGQDMEPVFCRGDVILCNKVNDMELINYGDAHLVVTSEIQFVKYVLPGKTKDSLLVKSANKDYPEWELKRSKVNYLYRVKGVLRRKVM